MVLYSYIHRRVKEFNCFSYERFFHLGTWCARWDKQKLKLILLFPFCRVNYEPVWKQKMDNKFRFGFVQASWWSTHAAVDISFFRSGNKT